MAVESASGETAAPEQTAPPRRPRGRNVRWSIITAITVLTITSYLDRGNLSVAAPVIRDDLGFSATEMGVILSAFIWPYAIMNLPSGWAVDRFGPKILMTVAALLWSIAGAATGLARNIATFLGLRVVLGVAEAPLFPGAIKATNEWFPDHEKARATSVYIAATQVGLAIAPPITTALLLAFGWELMFVLIGALGIIGVLGWLLVYSKPEKHRRLSREELTYIRENQRTGGAEETSSAEVGRQWLRLFRYPTIWAMIIGGFCLQYVFWFYITWLPSYLESAQHFSLKAAGLLSALPYIAGGIAVIIGGRFSDALVKRGMRAMDARRRTIAGGSLLTAIALAATAMSSGPAMAVTLLTVGMFTYSLTTASYWALATDVVQTSTMVGSVGSIQNFGGFLGGAFAPIATGIIVDRLGGFVPALIISAALLLVTVVMYGVLVRRRLPV
ncbi:MFS transporter [Saccharopolyspora phatthalungensis]|uniref:Sugar phosphate permease n=1 Tax=Saccharopolyspora phatthalungensis TaxID=664693 RepID=A0A840QJG5_9PSEU|nr:MFS transporter [Saccharopolyspora phatthalungensis]MBB5159055.1 sugar phosphate permease [Saccharopolyspora phatthalungensis]